MRSGIGMLEPMLRDGDRSDGGCSKVSQAQQRRSEYGGECGEDFTAEIAKHQTLGNSGVT
jgi:hypothetical protein